MSQWPCAPARAMVIRVGNGMIFLCVVPLIREKVTAQEKKSKFCIIATCLQINRPERIPMHTIIFPDLNYWSVFCLQVPGRHLILAEASLLLLA